ncbi:MAG: hypothetical protein J6P61_02545 [Erysipelotrichaceae bacterium]|nr:hypothetical protein [Erysipelotrichaceae bacterium]
MKLKSTIIALLLTLSLNITSVIAKSKIEAENLYADEVATLTITDIKKEDKVVIKVGTKKHQKVFHKKRAEYSYNVKLPKQIVKVKVTHYNSKKKIVAQQTYDVAKRTRRVYSGMYVYVTANKRTYHRANCVCLTFVNKIRIMKSAAMKKGYKGCKICKP